MIPESKSFGGVFEVEKKEERLKELSKKLEDPKVWKDHKRLQTLNQEKSLIQNAKDKWVEINNKHKECQLFIEIIEQEKDEKGFLDLKKDIEELRANLDQIEIQSLLNKEHDECNAYISIHSGAGGTEASDWAGMLYRMYSRWAEKQNYKLELLSLTEAEEAGIKSVTFSVQGLYSYGYLKGESGVHRLVRISPFDSNSRRHTSFSSVFSWPEVDDKIEVNIQPEQLRIDTYRASGAGGQHVNRTDSAVRITHLPTGIVVQCQNQRSQHANKDKAMKMLKAALYKDEMRKKEEEKAERESSKKANEWGSQIRSYILHPYQMVKDHRTQREHPNPRLVLNGVIDPFIEAYLKRGLS